MGSRYAWESRVECIAGGERWGEWGGGGAGLCALKKMLLCHLWRVLIRRHIKVVGTPTREEIQAMNPNYTEFKFPQIKAHPWNKVLPSAHRPLPRFSLSLSLARSLSRVLEEQVFRNKATPEAVDLMAKLLVYTPDRRLTPLQVVCVRVCVCARACLSRTKARSSCRAFAKLCTRRRFACTCTATAVRHAPSCAIFIRIPFS